MSAKVKSADRLSTAPARELVPEGMRALRLLLPPACCLKAWFDTATEQALSCSTQYGGLLVVHGRAKAGQAETEGMLTAGGRQRQPDRGSTVCTNADNWRMFMERFLYGIQAVMHRAFCKNSYFVCSLDDSLWRGSWSEYVRLRQKVIPPNGHHGIRVEMLINFRDITDTVYQPHDSGRFFPKEYDFHPECKIDCQMLPKISKAFFHTPHSTW